ncbi:OmpA family protein [Bdellovibrionota bacterium FG-2]
MTNFVALLMLLLLSSSVAFANGISVQLYSPSSSDQFLRSETAVRDFLRMDSVSSANRRFMFGMTYNFVRNPLVELSEENGTRVNTWVSGIQTFDAVGSLRVSDRVDFNFDVPVNWVAVPDQANKSALGDVKVFPKIHLSDSVSPVHFALVPGLWLPTGNKEYFVSDHSLGWGMLVSVQRDWGYFSTVGNFGFRRAADASFYNIDYRNRLPLSFGVSAPLTPTWSANAEVAGAVVVPLTKFQNPAEFSVGTNYRITKDFAMQGGVGFASLQGRDSTDYRMIVGLRFWPSYTPASTPAAGFLVAQGARTPAAPAPLPKPADAPPFQLDLREEIRFEHNSDVLTASARNLLDEVAQTLKVNRGRYRSLRIEGHTNDLGSVDFNLRLSKARALSVRTYLAGRGVDSVLLDSEGFGKERPKFPLDPKSVGMSVAAIREANRRVEFRLTF